MKKIERFVKLVPIMVMAVILCGLPKLQSVSADAKAYDYILPEADSRCYTEAEISNMNLQVLCYAKNEIYARHGRMFHSQELTDYFQMQPWYYGQVTPAQFSESVLNSYESANAKLVTDRELSLKKGGYILDQRGYNSDAVYDYIYQQYTQPVETFGYLIPDSDSRYVTSSDTQNMTLQELCYAKNEIYARRGRKFQSKELKDYFGSKSWYVGSVEASKFKDSALNTYEAENVRFLADCESSRSSKKMYQLDQPGYDIYAVRAGGSSTDEALLENDFIFADSDQRYLTNADLENLSPKLLCYAKNEIYARRGRTFEAAELVDHFWSKSWYNGYLSPKDFSTNLFNQYEAYNAKLLEETEFSKLPGGYKLS